MCVLMRVHEYTRAYVSYCNRRINRLFQIKMKDNNERFAGKKKKKIESIREQDTIKDLCLRFVILYQLFLH